MDIFISYSSKYRDLVERLRLALVAEGHDVFVDRVELQPGQPFDAELREAIADCDLFIYLISPESVAAGSYALAELALVQQRWAHPRGRVLPVKLAPTPLTSIPPYLKAVTMVEPQGDPVPGIVAAVAQLAPARRRLKWAAAGGVLLIAAAAAGWWWHGEQRRAVEAQQAITSAAEVCASGAYAAGWQRLEELAETYARVPQLITAREDCAMLWLREVRVRSDKDSFSAVVERVSPLLVAGLASVQGSRAADLRAHLGWGDALKAREGSADANPDAHFQSALRDDPGNAYANAMRGHWLAQRRRGDEAETHFRAAVVADRDRPFVRRMQIGAWLWSADYGTRALVVADDMRTQGETPPPELRYALWSPIYFSQLFNVDDPARFLAALPPASHLATFDWLYPQPRDDNERRIWRYCRAVLRANADQREDAIIELTALRDELLAARSTGRLLDQTQRALARLSPPVVPPAAAPPRKR